MSAKLSTIDLETFNDLVNSIYDAAMNADLWPVLVLKLARSLNAPSGLLRIQDLQSNQVGTYITHGLDPAFQLLYKEYYVQIDPLMPIVDQFDAGTVVQTASIMPASFKKTEFYNDYTVPQKMGHIIGGFLIKSDTRVAVLGIQRPDQMGCYGSHETDLVKRMVPHLKRAFQINHHLMQLTGKGNAACDVLHRLFTGVILVKASGIPVFINGRAENLINTCSGLTINHQGLQASTWADTQTLQALIYTASQPEQKSGGSLVINNPDTSQPLNILVVPVNRENAFDFGIDLSQVTAALFISTAGQPINLSLDTLCGIYGLTPAEARLVAALVNGRSLENIAEQFGLSKNTIRSQLKSCFQKTGTNRQAELVKLVLCDSAAMSNDNNS